MKKILSVFLAALFVICTAFAVPVTASAATRQHVENALETLQTKNGYIPGKSATARKELPKAGPMTGVKS